MFFSGFCLKNEEILFSEYQIKNELSISGFSFGAQKAFEYVLETDKRVDLLQFFSPAFFMDKDKKYKRMQLMFFKKDPKVYCDNFLKNCGFSENKAKQYFQLGSYEELEQLLNHTWDKEKLQRLKDKNIRLEVYLGAEDKIIDPQATKDFFKEFGEVYFIKNKNHIL